MGLRKLQDQCGTQARAMGWHDDWLKLQWEDDKFSEQERNWIAVKTALIAGEAHEAIDELRSNHHPRDVYYSEGGKPEGFGVELADVIIRTLDLAWLLDIDLQELINLKLLRNKDRGTRHGGKVM